MEAEVDQFAATGLNDLPNTIDVLAAFQRKLGRVVATTSVGQAQGTFLVDTTAADTRSGADFLSMLPACGCTDPRLRPPQRSRVTFVRCILPCMVVLGLSFFVLLWLQQRSGSVNYRWAFVGAVGAFLVAGTLPEFREMQGLSAASGRADWGRAGVITLVCMVGLHLMFRSLNPNRTAPSEMNERG